MMRENILFNTPQSLSTGVASHSSIARIDTDQRAKDIRVATFSDTVTEANNLSRRLSASHRHPLVETQQKTKRNGDKENFGMHCAIDLGAQKFHFLLLKKRQPRNCAIDHMKAGSRGTASWVSRHQRD